MKMWSPPEAVTHKALLDVMKFNSPGAKNIRLNWRQVWDPELEAAKWDP